MAKRKPDKNEKTETQESLNQEVGAMMSINWQSPDELLTRFVNNMTVQKADNEWFVSFYEIVPPLLVGSLDERRKAVENLTAVKATCVARIVVTEQFMERMVSVFQGMLPNKSNNDQNNTPLAG